MAGKIAKKYPAAKRPKLTCKCVKIVPSATMATIANKTVFGEGNRAASYPPTITTICHIDTSKIIPIKKLIVFLNIATIFTSLHRYMCCLQILHKQEDYLTNPSPP